MARADIHDRTDKEKSELALSGTYVPPGLRVIEVVLSERNLLSLLSKLYIDQSKKTIYNGDVGGGHILKLVAETDEVHYKDRHVAGEMHPDTEGLVYILKRTLEAYKQNRNVIQLFNKSVIDSRGESA